MLSDMNGDESDMTGVATGGIGGSHKTAVHLEGLPVHTELFVI